MRLLHITGAGTGVGKTFLTRLLLDHARAAGRRVAALKPFCSGGREDAIHLHAAQTAGLTLDEVNPFHFPEPLTPLLAARRSGRLLHLRDALPPIRSVLERGHPTVLEGAGGLLSPLGESFSLRDLIQEFPGPVMVVAPNALGVLNQLLLTAEALGGAVAAMVLMNQLEPDAASEGNAGLLQELLPSTPILTLPHFLGPPDAARVPRELARLTALWPGYNNAADS